MTGAGGGAVHAAARGAARTLGPESLARGRAISSGRMLEIVTPEGVPIRFELASVADRAGAFVLDLVIQLAVVFALGFALWHAFLSDGSLYLIAFVTVAAFLILTFYFPVFEVRWQGATPGKRKLGLRVIDARGGQLENRAVLARNLVRELEVWIPLRFLFAGRLLWPNAPSWALVLAGAWTFVFLLFPLFNKERMRVGDLIAGTRVVVRPRVVLAPDLVDERAAFAAMVPVKQLAYTFTEQQLGVYGIYELQVLEGLLRDSGGTMSHFEAMAAVSEKIRAKLAHEARIEDPERFLRDFYAALRAHLEQKLLFGQRREDKFSK